MQTKVIPRVNYELTDPMLKEFEMHLNPFYPVVTVKEEHWQPFWWFIFICSGMQMISLKLNWV